MAIKITSIKDAIEDTGLKALVYGNAGVGKTVLCATTGEPTLIISAEAGLLSIKDAPDYIKVVEVETISDLEEVYEAVSDGDIPVKWVALDSITEIAEQVLANELEQSRDPRMAYGNLQSRVSTLMRAFRDLKGYNVIMTCKQARVTDEYNGITLYQPMMPGTKLGTQIPYLFDLVMVMRVEKDEDGELFRFLQTERDVSYDAKDRSGKLSRHEAPSLKKIHEKIYGQQDEPQPTPVEKQETKTEEEENHA